MDLKEMDVECFDDLFEPKEFINMDNPFNMPHLINEGPNNAGNEKDDSDGLRMEMDVDQICEHDYRASASIFSDEKQLHEGQDANKDANDDNVIVEIIIPGCDGSTEQIDVRKNELDTLKGDNCPLESDGPSHDYAVDNTNMDSTNVMDADRTSDEHVSRSMSATPETGMSESGHQGPDNTSLRVEELPASSGQKVLHDLTETNMDLTVTEEQPSHGKKRRGRPKKIGGERIQLQQNKQPGMPKKKRVTREELLKLLPEDGTVTFSNEAHGELKKILKQQKSVQCPKEGCGKWYNQLISFKYHLSRCGVNVQFPCEICGKIYKSEGGLQYHMENVHRQKPKDEDAGSTVVEEKKMEGSDSLHDSNANMAVSRYGLRRGVPVRYEIVDNEDSSTEDENEQEEKDDMEKEEDSDSSSFEKDDFPERGENKQSFSDKWLEYVDTIKEEEQQQSSVEISGEAWELIVKETLEKLKTEGKVFCPKKCGTSLNRVWRVNKHLKACRGIENKGFRCKFCSRTFVHLSGMRTHITAKHRKTKFHADDESEYSAEGEDNCAIAMMNPKRQYKPNYSTKEFHENTEAWCKAFLCKPVFSSWQPTLKHWMKLQPSETADYLPVRKTSPCFKIQPATEPKKKQEYKEFQLPLFSSAPLDAVAGHLCSLTFNVGGSVWAMDWAPVPVDEKRCDQYLAIGCHRDQEEVHVVSGSYHDKGVLQIWRVPKLRNGKRPKNQAEFSLGIAYDYGPLWDIRWCLSGAWERAASSEYLRGHYLVIQGSVFTAAMVDGEEEMASEYLRRLGLLALACGDGKIRILRGHSVGRGSRRSTQRKGGSLREKYNVPFPDSVAKTDDAEITTNSENLIFRAIPHAELSPGSVCRLYRGECGAVWSVAWLPLEDHQKVVGSYCDGTVAVWDLTTQNPLLKLKVSDGLSECFFPISHFQAHSSTIRAVVWCPSDPNYIATTSYDRLSKIWDLRQTSQPVTTLKRGFNYQFSWPLHWASVMYTCDYLLSRGAIGARTIDYFLNARTEDNYSELPTNSLNSHNSTTWDVDYCNWTNMLASADAAGELQINLIGNCHVAKNHNKRTPVFRATFEEITQADATSPEPNTNNENAEPGISPGLGEKESAYKLIFKDTHPMFANKVEQKRLDKDTQIADVDKPPYAALHKVRWNPNITSYYWLATGGRAGIVRICHVDETL